MTNIHQKTLEHNGTINDIIATYHDDETNKDYVVYTDRTYSDSKLNIYCNLYTIINDKINVEKLETKEDKLLAQQIMGEILKEIKDASQIN